MSGSLNDFDYEAALAACARGDRAALRAIYERERRWLMAVALRITHRREVAEEVLHDAFVQIWRKAGTFDAGLGSARGWIYTVVRHRALNAVRSSARVIAVDDQTLAALADARGRLAAGMAMSTAARWPTASTASTSRSAGASCSRSSTATRTRSWRQRLATPLGTVKSWIRRALLALRECLA